MPTQELVDSAKKDFIRFIRLMTKFDRQHGEDPIVYLQPLAEKPYQDELEVRSYFACPVSVIDAGYDALLEDNKLFYSANWALHEFGKDGNVTGGKKNENCSRIRCFAIDVDYPLPPRILRQLIKLFNPYIVVASSIKDPDNGDYPHYKTHWYWPVDSQGNDAFDITLFSHWKEMQQALAFRMEDVVRKLDPKYKKIDITDKYITKYSGTLRAPGFLHQKDPKNVFLSQIISYGHDNVVTPKNIKEFFSERCITTSYIKTVGVRLEEIKRINRQKTNDRLQERQKEDEDIEARKEHRFDKSVTRYIGAVDGIRNTTMLSYVSELVFRRGFTLHETIGAAMYEDEERNDPPLGRRVVTEMATRIWGKDYIRSLSEKLKTRLSKGGSLAAKELFLDAAQKTINKTLDSGEAEINDGEEGEGKKGFQYDYSEEKSFISLTSDVSLAERFIQKVGNSILVHGGTGELNGYNEDRGVWDLHTGEGLVFSRMREVFTDVVKEPGVIAEFCDPKGNIKDAVYATFKKSMFSAATHENVARVLRNTPRLRIERERFNADTNLLCCKNGVVDLNSGRLLPFERGHYMTFSTDVLYRGTPEEIARLCDLDTKDSWYDENLWTKYIIEVMDGNLEMCRYLQKILGYVLRGENTEELMFFLNGTGLNGKSIFIETSLALLGSYSFAVPISVFMENSRENKATIIAQLPGKRLISTSEVGKGKQWDEEGIKSLSGADKVNARQHREVSFQYRPSFKTFVRGNHKPIIKGDDEGIKRRIRLIPFEVTIPEEKRDMQLQLKLTRPEMLQQVLMWAVAGHRLYEQEGLRPPSRADLATQEYWKEMHPIQNFISTCFEIIDNPRRGSTADQTLAVYNMWRSEHNEERLNTVTLGKKLTDANVRSDVVRKGMTSQKRYAIKIKENWLEKIGGDSRKVVSMF